MTQTYPPAPAHIPRVSTYAQRFPILKSYADPRRVIGDATTAGCMSVVIALPWSMIETHHQQALKNHGQSLTRLAGRGGLSASEAVAVLEDREWTAMVDGEDYRRLEELLLAYETTRNGATLAPIWAEGYEARVAGRATVDNPYTIHSPRGAAWVQGWSAAHRDVPK